MRRLRTVLGSIVWLALCAPLLAQPGATLPVDAFAQLPLMSGARLSPDGTHIGYMRPVDGRRVIIVQKLHSQDTPVVIPPFESLDFDWLHWATTERLVFAVSFSARRDFTETTETRLLSINRDGSDLQKIIRPAERVATGSRFSSNKLAPPQIQDDVIDWLPQDPAHILVALDEDFDARHEVRKVNILTGDYEIHRPGSRGIQNWIVDQQGEVRIGFGYDKSESVLWLRPPGAEWSTADDHDWRQRDYFPLAFTEDSNIAFVRGPNEQGLNAIRRLRLSDGALLDTVFEHDEVDIDGLVYDDVSGLPVGVTYVDDLQRIHYFDKTLDSLQASLNKVLPNTVNQIASISADRRRVLVHSFSDVEPGVYYLWDRDRKTMDFIAETMPGLKPAVLAPVKAVHYEARDGLQIPGFLTLPSTRPAEKLPTVILPHGGPAARDDRSFSFLSQFLASRGYAVLQPNFRGSSGYGRNFEHAGRNEWGGKMQDDVTDGARWLVGEGIADPQRMCIVGWSYGGYAAAMGAVKTPDLYRCAASINGVLNLPNMISDDKDYIGGSAWTEHVGLNDERAAEVSPYHQAERIKVPILIIQAEDDTRVHDDQGEGMAKRLRRLDKPVEYVEVELGGHSMNNEPARLKILQSLEAFLGEHLGGAVTDSASD